MSLPIGLVLEEIESFSGGENEPHSLVYVQSKEKLYTSVFGNAFRYNNPYDLTDRTTVDEQYLWHSDMIYVSATDKLYAPVAAAYNIYHLGILAIDPAAWTISKVIDYDFTPTYIFDLPALASDGTYLYVLSSNRTVYKFRLSDYGKESAQTDLTAVVIGVHTMRYDSVSGKLFVTSSNDPAVIVRINPSDMSIEDSAQFTSGQGTITDDFCFVDNYVFVGMEYASTTNNIIRVQKDSLDTRTLIDTGISNRCFATYYDGTCVLAVFEGTPGSLVVVDPSDLSVRGFALPTGCNAPNEIVSDENGRLFLTHYTSPGAISRLLPTYRRVSTGIPMFFNDGLK